MIHKTLLSLFSVIICIQSLVAQLVTSEPNFPKDTDEVKITFDATKGNAGLAGFTGEVYAHTGVITEASTSASDWKYVKTEWGQNTPETKLERVGNDLYELTISPSIREYYGVPDNEKILQISLVFRSADTSLEGKGEGNSDIFVDLESVFLLQVNSPSGRNSFYTAGEQVSLSFATPEAASFNLYLDGELVDQSVGTTYNYTHAVIDDQEVHLLTFSAISSSEGDSVGFIHSYLVNPQTQIAAIPAGMADGINYTSETTNATLVLTAPGKSDVFVLGDFNDWLLNKEYQMNQAEDKFWITITNLEPKKEYVFQYLIDGELLVADPYTEKVISPFDDSEIIADGRYPGLIPYPFGKTSFEASVIQTGKDAYSWQVEQFEKPAKEDLVIYELLVRDFTEERTFQAVIDQLDYLDSLGINALQLMPIMEFEGNLSWGYNPAFKFAVDKYYGTENDLKSLVDECHKRGIAVILDIVMNHHFGRSPLVRMFNDGDYGAPTSDNPWFNPNPKHDYNVGYDFNHESLYTQAYLDRVTAYWLEEYKIDGYRFDLSKGFTQKFTLGNENQWAQYDESRIRLLKRMADEIWSVDQNAFVILEHFAANAEEVELSNYGMMLWGNQHGTYIDTGLGVASDLNWGYAPARGWDGPNLIAYMESHDEERVLFEVRKQSSEPVDIQYRRMQQNAAFFLAIPGPKMVWQFGEFGYDLELNNDRLGVKPTKWGYLTQRPTLNIFKVYQAMINLKTQTDYMDEAYFSWESSGDSKWIFYNHPEVKIAILGNFSSEQAQINMTLINSGTWYDYLTGETITSTGSTMMYDPGEFHIYTSEPISNFADWNAEEFPLAITELLETELLVYPNPSQDYLYLLGQKSDLNYQIFDLNGKGLLSGKTQQSQVDIRPLAKGVYLLKVQEGSSFKSRKFVKQ